MDLLGKTTIHPVIFYSGKIAGYITWIIMFLLLFNIQVIEKKVIYGNNYISIISLVIGLIFITLSLINLGKSTRLGLPAENTELKTIGLYKISRNPMYVGFDLLTISAIVYSTNFLIFFAGIYSIIVYHFIILGEEEFLKNRFERNYIEYKKNVRRYL